MVQLAKNLGMVPLAEGVETTEELAFLRALDCTMGQGFLFSRPVPPDKLAELCVQGSTLIPPLVADPLTRSPSRRGRTIPVRDQAFATMHGPCAGTTRPRSNRSGSGCGRRRGSTAPPTIPTTPGPRFYALDMFPYPSGDLHMGHAEAFSRRRRGRAVPRAAGLQRHAPDRMGRVRAERRERRDQAPHPPQGMDVREHRSAGGVLQADGHVVRLVAHGPDVRPRVLPLDAVAVPAVLRAWAGLPEERAGQLVPARQDGAGERAGDRRRVRAMRHDGRAPRPDPVVLQDHRLRPAPAGRHGHARGVAGTRADDAAQLDRPQRGRQGHVHDRRDRRRGRDLHDAAGHAVGRHVLRVLGGASAREAAGGARRHLERRRAADPEGPQHAADVPGAGRHQGGRAARRARR